MNMRMAWLVVMGLLTMAVTARADDAKKDLDRLQGKWKTASMERMGMPGAGVDEPSINVEGDVLALIRGDNVMLKLQLTLDPTKTPSTVDAKVIEGPERYKGKVSLGIYKIEGGTWTWCNCEPGADDRPKEFKTTEDANHFLISFKKEADDEQASSNGTWLPVEATLAGNKFPEEVLKTMSLTLADGKYTVVVGEETDKGTYKVDTNKKPHTVDITGTDGPNKDKTILAIFELNKDTMTVCYALEGADRPTKFESTAKNKLFLVKYRRK